MNSLFSTEVKKMKIRFSILNSLQLVTVHCRTVVACRSLSSSFSVSLLHAGCLLFSPSGPGVNPCLPSPVSLLPSPFSRLPSPFSRLRSPFSVSVLPSPVSPLPSPFSLLRSPVSRLPSPFSLLPSLPSLRLPSPVSRLPSPVSRLPSPVSPSWAGGNLFTQSQPSHVSPALSILQDTLPFS